MKRFETSLPVNWSKSCCNRCNNSHFVVFHGHDNCLNKGVNK